MTNMSPEERAKKLVELDQVVTELKQLGETLQAPAETLNDITKIIQTDARHAQNKYHPNDATYTEESRDWEPTGFNLAELKQQHLKLRELIKKRQELESVLRRTMT